MRFLKQIDHKHLYSLIIILISSIAFALRITCCFWGFPYCLHPDEGVIVEPAINMLSRHSWEAFSYFRPDQVEIKMDSVIFSIVSWIRYRKPAYEAFKDHRILFFVAARALTALFGTVLIPLAVAFVGRLLADAERGFKRISQTAIAIILAFSPIFIQNSSYATPDIILSFFILLFAWFLLAYTENGDRTSLIACGISIGLGVATKYPAAIMCFMIAAVVIYRSIWVEKRPLNIIYNGLIVLLSFLATVFFVAPNLFTDYRTVYEHVVAEAVDKHAGANGLGFTGNLFFYFTTICKDLSAFSAVFFASGLFYIWKNKSSRWLSLLSGLVYWICISVLDLHWVRWGMPQYVFYAILVSIGIANAVSIIRSRCVGDRRGNICKMLIYILISAFTINLILSGSCQTKFSRIPDTRLKSMHYLNEHGITKENSIYVAYTPYSLEDGLGERDLFDNYGDYVNVIPFFATKEYYITNASWKERYLMEQENLRDKIVLCENIEQKYRLIYEEIPDGNYVMNPMMSVNIYQSLCYLLSGYDSTGSSILIYDLSPRFVSIQNKETKEYLNYSHDANGNLTIECTDQPSQWILYDDKDGSTALINAEYTDKKYLQYALIPGNTGLLLKADVLELVTAEGIRMLENQWTTKKMEGYMTFINSDGMALSSDDAEGIRLEKPEDKAERQKWLIIDD